MSSELAFILNSHFGAHPPGDGHLLLFSLSPNPILESPRHKFSRAHPPRAKSQSFPARTTRSGIPIFTPCFSPRLLTTSDHSSFTLMTWPSIRSGAASSLGEAPSLPARSGSSRAIAPQLPSAPSHRLRRGLEKRNIASVNFSIWSRYCALLLLHKLQVAHRVQQSLFQLGLSLLTASRPSASIRNCRSEYFRRNNSASAFETARLSVKVLTVSWLSETCLRKRSSAKATFPASLPFPRFQ